MIYVFANLHQNLGNRRITCGIDSLANVLHTERKLLSNGKTARPSTDNVLLKVTLSMYRLKYSYVAASFNFIMAIAVATRYDKAPKSLTSDA